MASKKKSTADKIQESENRLKLLRAKDAYEKAKASITGKK
jgi:hypothetical protein